jgi:hypothetical protein
MSGEEDLFLNQSEAEALFFTDALLGNADELDFESFGGTNGLDVSSFVSLGILIHTYIHSCCGNMWFLMR